MISWQVLLNLTLNTLALASLLAMLTMGLTLIFGILRIMNFAHGAIYMFGAYCGISAAALLGTFWVGLLVAPFAAGLLGCIFEFTLLRRLYRRDGGSFLLITFGLSLVLSESIRLIWGPNTRDVELPEILSGVLWIGDEPYPAYRIFLILWGILVLLALTYVFLRTRLGLLIRAIAQNAEMTQALGIDVGLMRSLTFAVGCAFAGLGGYLAVPLITGYIGMGGAAIIDSFVIVMIGGMGSLFGSVAGSVLVALTQTFGNFYLPELALVATYLLMIGVLLYRPGGLFGEQD
ncbi:branched-chain amino acid ABC transporter permease [Bradyrhizobium sp. CIAT3101]|uniref:branched-chain amino acid ABC transporter permease n=1 Tax=Bradyrhizobium sp. CIAT3101 TaxID=439387 RepID=UPI0024B08ECE|nr:branched-chain amino acid ABC transporter permease [Bradyrhizobium sp. CIAT3101]WFU79228.1 branched-chain amino acid ABC transporter permease [Bradyrhizobium sp. CIAT3101]